MRRNQSPPNNPSGRRAGFTLVEMLVATALIVLIMTMFATIFGMATQAMSQQKGMAELDQTTRTWTTMLSGDIHYRTMQRVMPYRPGQPTSSPFDPNIYTPEHHRGYFYIAENDKDDQTDDVLQFTIEVDNAAISPKHPFPRLKDAQKNDPFMYGRTATLQPGLTTEPNQPEMDDGQYDLLTGAPVSNGTGLSTIAEVAYFLRNGNLYRRQLLVRESYVDPNNPSQEPAATVNGNYDPADLVAPTAEQGIAFWRDFDYSAFFHPTSGHVRFHTKNSLKNENPPTDTVDGFPLSLAVPHLRFGHTLHSNGGGATYGVPREHLDYSTTPPSEFIGRYTAQECAEEDFGYPGKIPTGPSGNPANPMDRATPLALDTTTYLVARYSDETPPQRRGEEILLTNVHEFDIKVYDDGMTNPKFVDLGHSETDGFYQASDQQNPHYGNRFDTWHPGLPAGSADYATPYYPTSGSYAATPLGSPEERPLRGIQVRIRFYDPSTQQMRQVTRIFSLVSQ